MARINMEEINELHEAIAEIKKLKSQTAANKKLLVEALDKTERWLQDMLFTVIGTGFKKSK